MRDFGPNEAANLYQSYVRGWRAGAAFKAMEELFTKHENEQIRDAYARGYSDGRVALNTASSAASEHYGYTPSFLRACESA